MTLRRLSFAVGLTGLLIWAAMAVSASNERPVSIAADRARYAVEQATSRFLTSFENLDMPAFMSCFAEDATVFFPTPEPPERFNGKAAIRTHFQQVFDAIRKSASSGLPTTASCRRISKFNCWAPTPLWCRSICATPSASPDERWCSRTCTARGSSRTSMHQVFPAHLPVRHDSAWLGRRTSRDVALVVDAGAIRGRGTLRRLDHRR